ncbi:MAG TPA: GatB/YqeY domain-containing protein [Devosia sp.]|nr:GatB/YqeY domain-containing protein [Devosia sp.]
MREKISADLNAAMKAGDKQRTATLRLVMAAIKDRDIDARGAGREEVSEQDVLALLQKMVKQREESAAIYDEAGRDELATQEREEIAIIKDYLPQSMGEDEVATAIDEAIAATGAAGLRDMGKVVAALKEKYPGRIDFGQASKVVKEKLSGRGG